MRKPKAGAKKANACGSIQTNRSMTHAYHHRIQKFAVGPGFNSGKRKSLSIRNQHFIEYLQRVIGDGLADANMETDL